MTRLSGRSDELALAGELPAADRRQWRERVATVLRDSGHDLADAARPEDLLVTHLCDGVDVAALYTADDEVPAVGMPGLAPYVRGARALGGHPDGWDVRARHADPDAAVTAEAVRADLAGGVTSLWLVLGAGALPVEALSAVLAEVGLDRVPVALDAGPGHTSAAAEELLRLVADRRIDAAAVSGTLGVDPLGWLAGLDADTDVVAGLVLAGELAARCAREHPTLRAVTVDATAYHGGGADPAQELGCSLAAGVAYLRALTENDTAGLPVAEALGQLEFRYAAPADQFTTIALLRAARGLWSRVARECGVTGPESAQRQHAVTAEPAFTRRDPWNNILRGTLGCFGAGVGGADAVTVLPFDTALGLPDAFSRRVARNTQAVLIMESHLARVLDPAGGSWYVESLTAALARRAWEVFTGIERSGGLAAVLADGSLAEAIGRRWRARERRLATRDEPITGVSEFADPAEQLPVRTPTTRPTPRGVLPRVRPASAFEALRDRADAHAATHDGRRPAVFLATLGAPAAHTAWAGFAMNLFQAGGLATPVGGGTPEEIVAAYRATGTAVACLCGSDEAYAAEAADVARALADAGATVLLAGPPGIDGHVYPGCDAIEVLTGTLGRLGV